MAPGFTLKGLSLSPSRPNLPLQIPSSNVSPLSSPGRSPNLSPSQASQGYFPDASIANKKTDGKGISKDEAFKVVKHLEEVLIAWNEYKTTLSSAAKAGKKLSSALKDLAGDTDKTSVAGQTIKPSAAMIEQTSELLLKLAKKVDGAYDQSNADASNRSHDAYLNAVSKKRDKAEKAYRKASKSLGETSNAHSGLVALKNTLAEDIARANYDQATLLENKQSVIMLRVASSIGSLAGNTLSFYSDGLRKACTAYPDIEYFRALADVQWQGALPPDMDEEDTKRDEVRLLKTRVALGEMDTVGAAVWDGLNTTKEASYKASLTPTSAPRPSMPAKPSDLQEGQGGEARAPLSTGKSADGGSVNRQPDSPVSLPIARADEALEPRLISTPSTNTVVSQQSSTVHSSRQGSEVSLRQSLPEIPRERESNSRPETVLEKPRPSEIDLPISRPIPMARHVSDGTLALTLIHHDQEPELRANHQLHNSRPTYMAHAPRRSVSQIARDMERAAANERQTSFETHQSHRSFVSGCTLCGMDYDRMTQHRVMQVRRVTMPPAYSQPDHHDHHDQLDHDHHRMQHHRSDTYRVVQREVPRRHDSGLPGPRPMDIWHDREDSDRLQNEREMRRASYNPALHAPMPRRPPGQSPDYTGK